MRAPFLRASHFVVWNFSKTERLKTGNRASPTVAVYQPAGTARAQRGPRLGRSDEGLGHAAPGGQALISYGFQICEQSGSRFTTGHRPESDRNRPVRSRTQGGVGPVADVSQSRGPDSAFGLLVFVPIPLVREESRKASGFQLQDSMSDLEDPRLTRRHYAFPCHLVSKSGG